MTRSRWTAVTAASALVVAPRLLGASRMDREVELLAELFQVRKGAYTLALARRLGADGQVFATEIDPGTLARLRHNVLEAGLQNVTVREATPTSTGLPDACCDGILLRGVYHHLTDPMGTLAGLRRALRPGGRLIVVDFAPVWWLAPWTPKGIPADRRGHGVRPELVVREAGAAGFETVRRVESWPSFWFHHQYGLVFHVVDGGAGR
jgi:SAM-dependent methyltransferase